METSFILSFGRVRKAIRREFETLAAPYDITVPQFQVLKRLWEGDGIQAATLTKDICSDGGTITGVLDRLEARGLLCRERSVEDRRALQIYLTPEGRALQAPLTEVVRALNERALNGFTSQERAALDQYLQRIGGNLGDE